MPKTIIRNSFSSSEWAFLLNLWVNLDNYFQLKEEEEKKNSSIFTSFTNYYFSSEDPNKVTQKAINEKIKLLRKAMEDEKFEEMHILRWEIVALFEKLIPDEENEEISQFKKTISSFFENDCYLPCFFKDEKIFEEKNALNDIFYFTFSSEEKVIKYKFIGAESKSFEGEINEEEFEKIKDLKILDKKTAEDLFPELFKIVQKKGEVQKKIFFNHKFCLDSFFIKKSEDYKVDDNFYEYTWIFGSDIVDKFLKNKFNTKFLDQIKNKKNSNLIMFFTKAIDYKGNREKDVIKKVENINILFNAYTDCLDIYFNKKFDDEKLPEEKIKFLDYQKNSLLNFYIEKSPRSLQFLTAQSLDIQPLFEERRDKKTVFYEDIENYNDLIVEMEERLKLIRNILLIDPLKNKKEYEEALLLLDQHIQKAQYYLPGEYLLKNKLCYFFPKGQGIEPGVFGLEEGEELDKILENLGLPKWSELIKNSHFFKFSLTPLKEDKNGKLDKDNLNFYGFIFYLFENKSKLKLPLKIIKLNYKNDDFVTDLKNFKKTNKVKTITGGYKFIETLLYFGYKYGNKLYTFCESFFRDPADKKNISGLLENYVLSLLFEQFKIKTPSNGIYLSQYGEGRPKILFETGFLYDVSDLEKNPTTHIVQTKKDELYLIKNGKIYREKDLIRLIILLIILCDNDNLKRGNLLANKELVNIDSGHSLVELINVLLENFTDAFVLKKVPKGFDKERNFSLLLRMPYFKLKELMEQLLYIRFVMEGVKPEKNISDSYPDFEENIKNFEEDGVYKGTKSFIFNLLFQSKYSELGSSFNDFFEKAAIFFLGKEELLFEHYEKFLAIFKTKDCIPRYELTADLLDIIEGIEKLISKTKSSDGKYDFPCLVFEEGARISVQVSSENETDCTLIVFIDKKNIKTEKEIKDYLSGIPDLEFKRDESGRLLITFKKEYISALSYYLNDDKVRAYKKLNQGKKECVDDIKGRKKNDLSNHIYTAIGFYCSRGIDGVEKEEAKVIAEILNNIPIFFSEDYIDAFFDKNGNGSELYRKRKSKEKIPLMDIYLKLPVYPAQSELKSLIMKKLNFDKKILRLYFEENLSDTRFEALKMEYLESKNISNNFTAGEKNYLKNTILIFQAMVSQKIDFSDSECLELFNLLLKRIMFGKIRNLNLKEHIRDLFYNVLYYNGEKSAKFIIANINPEKDLKWISLYHENEISILKEKVKNEKKIEEIKEEDFKFIENNEEEKKKEIKEKHISFLSTNSDTSEKEEKKIKNRVSDKINEEKNNENEDNNYRKSDRIPLNKKMDEENKESLYKLFDIKKGNVLEKKKFFENLNKKNNN